jgi:propionyl-CoA carboxylase beta chain
MTMREKLKQLEELRRQSELGGGEERIEAQHKRGKLSARERLDLLLDEGSFVELDRFVTHRTSGFGLEDQKYLGDGVVTGYGTVKGAWSTSSARTSPCSAGRCPRPTPRRS